MSKQIILEIFLLNVLKINLQNREKFNFGLCWFLLCIRNNE